MPIETQLTGFEEASTAAEGLPALVQSQVLERAMRASVRPVQKAARKFVTQPGYPGDKPDRKPLRNTIGIRLKQYRNAWVAIVGPQWPAGAHGYNVEHGHGGPHPAPAHPYMAPAIAATRHLVQSTFESAVTREVQRAWERL